MKKFSLLIAAILMLFSTHAFAGKYTTEMLKQTADENSSLKPIIGTNMYKIERKNDTIYVLLFYKSYKHVDGGLVDADPELDDVRVVFQVKHDKCKLIFIDEYAGLDLLKKNIDLLVADVP